MIRIRKKHDNLLQYRNPRIEIFEGQKDRLTIEEEENMNNFGFYYEKAKPSFLLLKNRFTVEAIKRVSKPNTMYRLRLLAKSIWYANFIVNDKSYFVRNKHFECIKMWTELYRESWDSEDFQEQVTKYFVEQEENFRNKKSLAITPPDFVEKYYLDKRKEWEQLCSNKYSYKPPYKMSRFEHNGSPLQFVQTVSQEEIEDYFKKEGIELVIETE